MDDIYNWLVKAGPGWTMFVMTVSACVAAVFVIAHRQNRILTNSAHAEQLKLKEDANAFLRERIAGLEVEKSTYKETSHNNANIAQKAALELAEYKTRPNVDSIVIILREFQKDQLQQHSAQAAVNDEILTALKQLNTNIKTK